MSQNESPSYAWVTIVSLNGMVKCENQWLIYTLN